MQCILKLFWQPKDERLWFAQVLMKRKQQKISMMSKRQRCDLKMMSLEIFIKYI